MIILASIIAKIIVPLLMILRVTVIVAVIFSWLTSFGIIDTRNEMVSRINYMLQSFLYTITSPFRRWIPSIGGIDFSPIFVILGLIWLEWFLGVYVVTMLTRAPM